MSKVVVPFTEDQVESLNKYQVEAMWHPFTCANDHHGSDLLVASVEGWKCPSCDYTQDWAHDFMADWSWKKLNKAAERIIRGILLESE